MTKLRMSRSTGIVAALLLLTVSSATADDCLDDCHEEAMEICGSCEYGDDRWEEANDEWGDCVESCGA